MGLTTEFLIAVITVLFIPLCYYYYFSKTYRMKRYLENFPNPPTHFLLGNTRRIVSPGALLNTFHEYARTYGSLVHLQLGPIGHALLCSDYKFLEFLLGHNKLLTKSDNLKFLEPWIGTGLVTTDGGPKWRIHRKLITPAFHFKILEQFVDIFESDGTILVEKLSDQSGNKSVDIYPYITKCTLEAICETAMGTKVDIQNSEASSYFQSCKDMCRIFIVRTMSPLLRYDFAFSFSKYYPIQQKAVKILHDYTENVIKTKREELEQKRNDIVGSTDELGRKKKKAFLDLILEARVDNQSLSDEEIREEVDTFMFAGHDTTATAISFILYCIANNKEVQDRIIEEQEQLLGKDKNPKVTYTNFQEMKYLENVIKEGLRLYPPVPFFGRMIDEDTEYNGMIIPNGLGVIIFVQAVHMNPEFYPNPEKFDPSRFENMDSKRPFAYIPFSAGPRNCIGQKFAMLEMKSLVSKIVRNFELFPAIPHHELDLSPETVLKSLNGVRIGLKIR